MISKFIIIFTFIVIFCRADDTTEKSATYKLSKSDEDFLKEQGIDIKLVHGTAIIRHRNQSRPMKRDTSSELDIEYRFTNGTVVKMTVKQQSNNLATKNTRVWRSTGLSNMLYHDVDCEVMEDVGDFSFYHDANHIVALVYFHKDQTVQGYYYIYELIGRQRQPGEQETSYFLVQNTAFRDHIGAGGSPVLPTTPPILTRQSPQTVYPQLLIVLTKKSVRNGATKAIRSALVYWNAVDMLFSLINEPKIKINIAGLVLPQNDGATPWMSYMRQDGYLEMEPAHDAVSAYFKATERLFSDEKFDLIVGMTSVGMRTGPYNPDQSGAILGRAHVQVPCSDRNRRSAILEETCSYLAGTHEITHIFGARHDQVLGCPSNYGIMSQWYGDDPLSFRWSTCAQNAVSAHFRYWYTKCYDNIPTPVTTCFPDPTPAPSSVPSNVCPQSLLQICKAQGYNEFLLDPYSCRGHFWCSSPASPQAIAFLLVKVPDGTVCQWGIDGTVAKVCYNNECEPYTNSNAACPPVF